MANLGKPILQSHKTNVSSTSAETIDWSGEGGVQRVYVTAITADVYIAFDEVANADSFRVKSGDHPAEFELGTVVKTISLLGVAGTNEVYVMGMKS